MSSSSDIRWLTALVAGELTLQSAYEQASGQSAWAADESVKGLLGLLLQHERLHVQALKKAGAPLSGVEPATWPASTLASAATFLSSAADWEAMLAGAYVSAAGSFSDVNLAQAAALTGAAEAEHQTLIAFQLQRALPAGGQIAPVSIDAVEQRLRSLGWQSSSG